MKKSKFNLTYLNSTTCDAGRLVPFLLQPTIPNDTFRISLSSFIRAQPMLAPLMHEVKFYTQYWFVPYRLIWDDWEDFITGGDALNVTPAFPVLPSTTFRTGDLGDYFGYPVGVDCAGISVLPFRAYAEIWNTRYRDEDLQGSVTVSYNSGTDRSTSLKLLSPSWRKDYFTTARPFTQRGSQVSVPVNTSTSSSAKYGAWTFNSSHYTSVSITPTIPYLSFSGYHFDLVCPKNGTFSYNKDSKQLIFTGTLGVSYVNDNDVGDEQVYNYENRTVVWNLAGGNPTALPLKDSPYPNNNVTPNGTCFSGDNVIVNGNNISAIRIRLNGSTPYFPYVYSSGSVFGSMDIRDLRLASSMQRYAERSLLWGNRYEEFIQREFGIKPRDARIQRPEYLGGGSGILQISEVLQTAEGSNTGVGTMRGHGVAGLTQRPIRFRAPEHGLILGLISIRPVPVYTQGINREFLKKSRLDFFTPELANVGMQEVLQRELYVTADNASTVFGYSDRYQEYRYNMPKVTGEFRSTLDFWNMARKFSDAPVLNASFLDMASSDPAFKRPFASKNTHSFLMMIRNNIKAYRPIPKRAKNILK